MTLRPPDLLQPTLTGLHRLPARAPLALYANADDALRARRPRRRVSLDGTWDLRLVDCPEDVPVDWLAQRTGRSGQSSSPYTPVEVPGCWTRQGLSDLPHYTNIVMPWAGLEAPETPEHNPVGLYRRSFELAKSWMREDIVLHLGGFESVAAVWCNGTFVGMGKDSRLPSEFLLNEAAHVGSNQLDIMVIRYSDATWIEDQDHWWHGGLHRSVHVEARPRQRIDDVAVVADYVPRSGRGRLDVTTHICGRKPASVRVTLFDGDEAVGSKTAAVPMVPAGEPLQQLITSYSYPGRVATVSMAVPDVRPWTAETPELYHVVVEMLDDNGACRMATRQRVGFRRIEVRDRRFLVNGVPIVFHGVNRHDHHPDTGKVQTVADLRADLVTMKRHNINAVRCAHYPNDHRLLDLCDEIGLYVIDEANIECHARLRSLSDDPRYLPAMMDRVTRMVIRDRNHPSVLMWSLGNESGHGTSQDAAAAWVRAADPSRPVHYEGALQSRFVVERHSAEHACQAPSARERAVTDIVCPMYTPVDVVETWAEWAESTGLDDRPLILCEFSHAMGNSNGDMDRYGEAFHRHPALAGGFIWDWRDQGLRTTDDNGREFWAYGGHFGDEPNDANFCINGLVGPDGVPHPGLTEVAWAYQPVRVTHAKGRRVRIENRRAFVGLDDLNGQWELFVNGALAEFGVLDIEIAGGKSRTITIPFASKLRRDSDAVLRFTFRQHATTEWFDAGHVVAVDEIALRTPAAPDLDVFDVVRLRSAVSAPASKISTAGSSLRWDDRGLFDLILAGLSVVPGHIEPCLWRAPVDNDGVAQGWMSQVSGVRPAWIAWGLDALRTEVVDVRVFEGELGMQLEMERHVHGVAATARNITTVGLLERSIVIDEALLVPDAWQDVPRVGTRFELDPSFERLDWFGRGPHESYPDRRSSAMVGEWSSTIADQYHDYVVPQEHGAHADTRSFVLTSPYHRLRFDMATPLSFSARHHHDATLTAATTIAELDASDSTEIHIDAAVRGLGTGACGPDASPDNRVGPGWHKWRFSISAE